MKDESVNTKMVIIWRNDLKVRKGKIAAQVAHASMAFLTKEMNWFVGDVYVYFETKGFNDKQAEAIVHWLKNSFRKIIVYVDSEEELREIYQKALDKGLIASMIVDSGLTEFNGVPTKTCVAIGPANEDDFTGLTDHLPLL